MGRCHEFGSQIREGCGHPMRAGERACACPECGVICQGQFDGCPDVWARGPRPVALSIAPAISAPRVRALSAGPVPRAEDGPSPEPARAQARAQAAASPVNGRSRVPPASSAPPPPRSETANPPPPLPPPPRQADSRTEILQWFEDAFDELRNELHAVVSTVSRQQAMLAELMDSRDAELRVVMAAESLPELAGEAAAKALADQSDSLADVLAGSLEDFQATVAASELSSVAVMDGMRELLRRIEVTAEMNAETSRMESAARLESLKASVARQIRPLSAAVAELAAYADAAEEREAARRRALKASVTKQLQPLAEAVAELRARLDAPAKRPSPAPAKAAPKRAAPAPAKAARAKAPAADRRTPLKAVALAKRPPPASIPSPGDAPAAGRLLIRRRAGAPPTGRGPRAGA